MAEGGTEMSKVNIRDYKPSDEVILRIEGVNRIYKDEEYAIPSDSARVFPPIPKVAGSNASGE